MDTPIADAIAQYKAGTGSDPLPQRPVNPVFNNPQIVRSKAVDLWWKYGINFPNWGNYAELLMDVGLSVEDITPNVVDHARSACKKRLNDQIRSREVATLSPGSNFKMPAGDDILSGRVVSVKDTEVQVEVVREDGQTTTEQWSPVAPVIPSNRKKNDDNIPVIEPSSSSSNDGRSTVKLSEKTAREVLVAAGLPGVDGWSVKKLTNKINELHELVEDGASEPSDSELCRVYHQVVKDLKAGGEIEIEEGEVENSEPPNEGEATVAASNGKPKKIKTQKLGGNDEYGCRLGGKWAAINAVLTTTPHSLETVAKKAGHALTVKEVRSHVRHWAKKGRSMKEEDGKVFLVSK